MTDAEHMELEMAFSERLFPLIRGVRSAIAWLPDDGGNPFVVAMKGSERVDIYFPEPELGKLDEQVVDLARRIRQAFGLNVEDIAAWHDQQEAMFDRKSEDERARGNFLDQVLFRALREAHRTSAAEIRAGRAVPEEKP